MIEYLTLTGRPVCACILSIYHSKLAPVLHDSLHLSQARNHKEENTCTEMDIVYVGIHRVFS